MRATLSDIALKVGVSVSTVSRVLGGTAVENRIPSSTVEKILSEARRCGYIPNRAVRDVRNNFIGLLLPSVANPYFAEMASHIISRLRPGGYSTIVMEHNDSPEIFREAASTLILKGLDAIIAVPATIADDEAFQLETIDRKHCPVVLIDRTYYRTALPFVCTDNYRGGLMATRKLIDAGHKRIACVQGVVDSMPNIDRVRGYRTAMAEAGLDSFISVSGNDFSIANGYDRVRAMIKSGNLPDALFTLGNTIAIGAVEAIKEAGLLIGRDISLISFDNNINLGHIGPSIAAVCQPIEDMTSLAVKITLSKLSGVTGESSQILLTPSFLDGDTLHRI